MVYKAYVVMWLHSYVVIYYWFLQIINNGATGQ